MLRASTLPLPDFNLNLVLPRKTFVLGDKINYEVIVDNTDGRPIEFLTITLIQNMVELVVKRRGKKSFKFSSNRIAHKSTGPGYSSTTWMDSLQIPYMIPPSLDNGMTNLADKRVQPVSINYFLKVHATQCESFSIPSEDFPIQILPSRNQTESRNSGMNSNVAMSLPSIAQGRRTEYESIDRTPQHFPLARRGLGLGPNDPPRYSTLSLNTQAVGMTYGFPGSATSLETLPPDYDDLPRLQ